MIDDLSTQRRKDAKSLILQKQSSAPLRLCVEGWMVEW